jgi:hypothetical protein
MTEPACRHRLGGLEPDNLLAFLALLGLLRSLEAARLEWRPRTVWDLDRAPLRPVLVLAELHTPREVSEAAAVGASQLAEVYHFSAEKQDATAQNDLNYSDAFARKLLNDAAAEDDRERADLWAALMCDAAARDGRIEATPLCLLFGQGHQHFLDRLMTVPRTQAPPPRGRGKNMVNLTAGETIGEALFQPWTRQDPTPGFRWDPAEDVRYALRANDPSGEKSTTQHGANRLAALGLPVLTSVPVQRGNRVRLQVLGGSFDRDFALAWPIWSEPASLTAIRAMLTHPELINGPAKLRHLGIEQVRRARRISVGRFMNFARAEMVG